MPRYVKYDPCRTTSDLSLPRRLSIRLVILSLLSLAVFAFQSSHSVGAETDAGSDVAHGRHAVRVLTPNSPVTTEISGGETQTLEVELNAGQYCHLSINKRDLNLTLHIYDPNGRSLGEYAGQKYGGIEASLIADAAGTYRLAVRSLDNDGVGRRYELKVESLRSANAEDFKIAGAMKIVGEASKLRAKWTKVSLLAAANKFMEGWSAWRAARQSGGAIDALLAAAEVHFTLGDYRQSLQLYRMAADESRRAGDRHREHAALASAGRACSYLGDNDLAQKYLETVLNYYEEENHANGSSRDKRLLAEALNNMGEVYLTKGTPLKAFGYVQRSLLLWKEADDRSGESLAHLNLGYALSNSGDLNGAVAQFEQALALARAVGDRTAEALSLTASGLMHSFKGEEQAALRLHLEALSIARTVGDRQSEAVTLNGLGQAYEGIGQKHVALDHYKQALRLFLTNQSLDFAAGTEYRVARIYRLTGDITQALAHYNRCITLSRRAHKKRIEAYALTDIAAVHRAQGRRGETLKQYYKVLQLYRQVGDRRGQAILLNNIGDLASESGDKRKALNFYKQALPLTQAVGDREAEASTLYNAARAARDAGNNEEALAYARQSVQLIETLRTYVAGPDLRASFVASIQRHYGHYVDLLMHLNRQQPGQHYDAAALLANEHARARSLLEILAEAGTDIRRGAVPELLEHERTLQQALRVKARQQMQLSSDAETEAEAAEAARELRQLTAEYHLVQSQIREQNPRYAALTQPRPVSLEDIQAELRAENTILLEYALGDEKSYLWIVTANSLNSYELPGRATVEAHAREVYGLLTSRQSGDGKIDAAYQARVATADAVYEKKALALSRMLLGPASAQLGGQRLLIVAEGVLQYIPFEALPVPNAVTSEEQTERAAETYANKEWPLLVSRHEVVNLPSMSALITLRRERSRLNSAPGLVAVLADPVYETNDQRVEKVAHLSGSTAPREPEEATPVQLALRNFEGFNGAGGIPRLRHTADEAEAIMSLAPASQRMIATGFAANRETAMSSKLEQYQIIHFAAHGLVNNEHPELSGIILSLVNKEGGRADGFLQLHDIYDLRLAAELVVLSACNTGLGEDVQGEGLVGLTRVFLYAGSKSVVASLWKVDDTATAELMRHFYKAMLEDGLPPAAALRFAKEAMRRQKRWQAPYYWSGFVVQGEYRQRIKTGYGRPARGIIVALAIFFGCTGLYTLARLRDGFRRRKRRGAEEATPYSPTPADGSRTIKCLNDRL
jgi:CHAT domain-containing protein/tetratricopeptide (TPR) repeat protein